MDIYENNYKKFKDETIKKGADLLSTICKSLFEQLALAAFDCAKVKGLRLEDITEESVYEEMKQQLHFFKISGGIKPIVESDLCKELQKVLNEKDSGGGNK